MARRWLALALLTWFAGPGLGQESRPESDAASAPATRSKRVKAAPTTPQFESIAWEAWYSRVEGDEILYVLRRPTVRAGDVVIEAERGVAFLDAEEYARQATSKARIGSGDALRPGPALPSTAGRDIYGDVKRRLGGDLPVAQGPMLTLQDSPFGSALRALYLDGDVHFRKGDQSTLSGTALLVDVASGRLLLVDGSLRFDLTSGGRPMALLARAKVVRQEISGVMQLTDGEVTTCEFAMPHYHVRSSEISIRAISRQEVFIESHDNKLTLTDVGSMPIPDVAMYSTDMRFFPIEQVNAGASRRDGAFLRTQWGHDFKDLGDDFNAAIGVKGEFKGHWSLNVDYMSKRGLGLGGSLAYETEGVYKGETTAYLLRDHGENVGFLSTVYEKDKIYRGEFHSVDRIYGGKQSWLDIEITTLSDPNFLPEFYPNIFKTEKYYENIFYYRTANDGLSFFTLVKTQFNEFLPVYETGVENGGPPPSDTLTYPRLDGRFYPAPIAELPVPGGLFGDPSERPLELIYRGVVNGGYFVRHFSEANYQPDFLPPPLDPQDQSALEATTAHELSTPFSFGLAKLVPYVEVRGTAASNSLPAAGAATGLGESPDSVSQLLSTAGARIGSHLEGDAGRFRHTVDTRIDYRNTFDSTEDGDVFIPFFDQTQPDVQEVVTLDFRNRFSLRDRDTQENLTFADLRLAMPFFPDKDRDNNGDSLGPLRADFRFDFGPRFAIPDLRIRYRSIMDPYGFSTVKSDTSFLVSPFGPELDLSVSYREANGSYEALAFGASYRLDRKWYVDFIEQYDFFNDESIQTKVALRRHEHDWAFEIAFGYDTSDNELSITFSFIPLAVGGDRPRDRFVVPTTTFRGFY